MAITDVLKLIQSISGTTGTSTTTGGTKTTQTKLDQNTVNGLLKSALESNQGLASVTQGQVGAGLYNSSTNTMLTNDLLSRLTTDIAAKSAPTTVTSTPTKTVQSTPGLGTAGMLGLGAVSLLKNPIDKILSGIKTGGSSVAGNSMSTAALNGWDTEMTGGASDAIESTADMSTAALSGFSVADSGATDMADAAFNAGSGSFDNWFSDNYSNVASTISDTVSDSGGEGDWLSGIGDAVSGVKDWFADLF